MDVLADVLSATRMGSSVVAQAELVPPWGLEVVSAEVLEISPNEWDPRLAFLPAQAM